MPPLRVTLEITAGPDKGRKQHLSANQVITVGRTEWADFVLGQDARMSGEHFSLQVDGEACRLRDLDSTNGTSVNGKPVKQAELADGDEITAGDTQFVVRIGGSVGGTTSTGTPRPTIAAPPPRAPQPGPTKSAPPRAAQPADASDATPEILVGNNAAGLSQARSGIALLPPRELVERLRQIAPVYMIVDFGRLGIERPADLVDPQPLFDWLPESAAAMSPVIVDPQAWPAALDLIESGWGADAVICLGSHRPPEDLVAHLRGCARMRRDSVLGYCWPTVLSALLVNCAHEMVQRLLAGIDYVVTENPEDSTQWQVFSYTNLQMTFDQVGLPTTAATATG